MNWCKVRQIEVSDNEKAKGKPQNDDKGRLDYDMKYENTVELYRALDEKRKN